MDERKEKIGKVLNNAINLYYDGRLDRENHLEDALASAVEELIAYEIGKEKDYD